MWHLCESFNSVSRYHNNTSYIYISFMKVWILLTLFSQRLLSLVTQICRICHYFYHCDLQTILRFLMWVSICLPVTTFLNWNNEGDFCANTLYGPVHHWHNLFWPFLFFMQWTYTVIHCLQHLHMWLCFQLCWPSLTWIVQVLRFPYCILLL